MIVAASTECFADLPLDEALERLAELEFTSVELDLHEQGRHLRPSDVAADPDRAAYICRQTHRLTPVAFSLDIRAEGEEYYRQFQACCTLAKAMKVVALTVPSAELGTPFNEEIERLRRLVSIATLEGVLVGIKTETGRMSQDPDTTGVLCDNVKGLGVTLDPSHYLAGPHQGTKYKQLLKHVIHVHLRDSTKKQLQVRIGQGEIEYGKLLSQLEKVDYRRALSVHLAPMEGADHIAELRKLRLLLESLL